ncbi:MAG TPA: AAA family ATPase [Rhizomicrobium sp.]|nr:AAA family ATPase [Rhizomicrobium sp.]
MTPTPTQAEAIRAILAWYDGGDSTPREFYLAGYAGTGKTTIYRVVRDELRARGVHVLSAAFTGKAALVLRRKGIDDAQTLHSLLYSVSTDAEGRPVFTLDSFGPMYDANLLAVDEVSMVGEGLANDARSFGKKILVLGDPGQLPPVKGAGAFTNREPDYFLSEIHRQAAESPIIRLATLAREGQPIPVGDYGDNVRVLPLNGDTWRSILDPDTQVICGTHKTRFSATQRIREHRGFGGRYPLAGERVLCMRNDRKTGIFNGGLGTMLADAKVWPGDGNMDIDVAMDDLQMPLRRLPVHRFHFDQHFGTYERPRIHRGYAEFDWGNVLTCHKAQGSEFPHVTAIDDSGAFGPERNKWNYTTLTRASDGVTYLKRAA